MIVQCTKCPKLVFYISEAQARQGLCMCQECLAKFKTKLGNNIVLNRS
jgi:hypothetical protein